MTRNRIIYKLIYYNLHGKSVFGEIIQWNNCAVLLYTLNSVFVRAFCPHVIQLIIWYVVVGWEEPTSWNTTHIPINETSSTRRTEALHYTSSPRWSILLEPNWKIVPERVYISISSMHVQKGLILNAVSAKFTNVPVSGFQQSLFECPVVAHSLLTSPTSSQSMLYTIVYGWHGLCSYRAGASSIYDSYRHTVYALIRRPTTMIVLVVANVQSQRCSFL